MRGNSIGNSVVVQGLVHVSLERQNVGLSINV